MATKKLEQLLEELSTDDDYLDDQSDKMPGYRFRFGSFSSHSSRGSNQDGQAGGKANSVKYEIKLAVLGKTGVGKTAIIHRFLYDQFPEKHKETIDEVYMNELELVKGADTR